MKGINKLLLIFVALLLFVAPVVAQDDSPEANKAILVAFAEAEAARDYDRMDEFFVEDFVRHSAATTAIMPEGQVSSLEEYVQFLRDTAAMFPDYYNTPQMLIAEGDYVAFYLNFSGTFAENGNHIEIPIVGYARFEAGKIAEMWIEWDNVTWNAQMMAAPVETSETPIVGIEDVVGVWRIHGRGWAWFMETTPDGQVYVGPRGCAPDNCVEHATFDVANGQIHWWSRAARYDVFVTRQGDAPASLRFELVGSDNYSERREALDGQMVFPVEP
jgi:predicted ester cyclase